MARQLREMTAALQGLGQNDHMPGDAARSPYEPSNSEQCQRQFDEAAQDHAPDVRHLQQMVDADLIASGAGYLPSPLQQMERQRRLKMAVGDLTGELVRPWSAAETPQLFLLMLTAWSSSAAAGSLCGCPGLPAR
jgi:hypothetical protein